MPAGRYAPSPSGDLHLGNLRTAVVAWLLARHARSRFVVRIEDLDPACRSNRWVDQQIADLAALGLEWDGEIVKQSGRFDLYHDALDTLTRAGRTFECYCTRREVQDATRAAHDAAHAPAYPGTCRDLSLAERRRRTDEGRPAALRLRGAPDEVTFVDTIAGPFSGPVDDLVIRRNDGTPAYNIAVVVDDADQHIEQVVRGDDLLAATPVQIYLGTLLGLPAMTYAHVPLVLGPSGERLAKRDGAVSLTDLAAVGIGPELVLARIGASLGLCEADEAVTASALLDRFDPSAIEWTTWTVDPADISTPRTR
jgi:glutamyl-tRNA synthetase